MTELSNDFNKAKTHALKIIGQRDHSGGEIIKKLSKYYERETCEKALEWLRELGYQNDVIYAEKIAALFIETKKYGVRKARYEMKLKGLSAEDIDTALEAYDDENILEIITDLIQKKYVNFLDDYAGIKKTTDALMRRGYDYDDIKTAISHVKEEM